MVDDGGEGKYDDVEGGMMVDDGGEEGGGGREISIQYEAEVVSQEMVILCKTGSRSVYITV